MHTTVKAGEIFHISFCKLGTHDKPVKTFEARLPSVVPNGSVVSELLDRLKKQARDEGLGCIFDFDWVLTDEVHEGYCWKCKKAVKFQKAYGSWDEPICSCGQVLTTSKGGKCACGGQFWQRSRKRMGRECVKITLKCDKCGETDVDVLD